MKDPVVHNTTQQKLSALFRARFHGAANVRGIQYQLLYSVLCAFDLYQKAERMCFLRLEGIEDVDLLGLQSQNEYIQVKSSQSSWNWSKLKEPLENFLQVHRTDPTCCFLLVVNFPLRKELAQFAHRASLPSTQRNWIEGKFRDLCKQVGAATNEAEALTNKVILREVSEERLWNDLRRGIAEAFQLGSAVVDTYILVLVATFLQWAHERKEIVRADLDRIRLVTGEHFAREAEFQAYGRSLIQKLSWTPDQTVTDFYEGKNTRASHIAANVDVRRPRWLDKIDQALRVTKVCILRSSSGQGKSSLLYRYALEHWPPETTYILRVAESHEHVELIAQYLRFRGELGLPVCLLVDDAGWRTRFWPFVVRECAALGIPVLVAVRSEDWYRFARDSFTNYEILEPILALDEAREIFEIFKREKRLHSSIKSPEWVYEKIGEPHLLMEYIYLLTHGQMLEERLRDQMKQFIELQEDPAKIEILRRTALASTLGTPVLAEKLLREIPVKDDPQRILLSLKGEYLNISDGLLTGLHWVRSDHLARILHEGYPAATATALAVLEAAPAPYLAIFSANALCDERFNEHQILTGLAEKAKGTDLQVLLAILDGIFEAGERRFCNTHRELFANAYTQIGPGSGFLLSSMLLPIGKVDLIEQLVPLYGDKRKSLDELRTSVERIPETQRGLDLCGEFLRGVSRDLPAEILQKDLSALGRFLDWCALCRVDFPLWHTIKQEVLKRISLSELSLEIFCDFSQGFYRYDEPAFRAWFSHYGQAIMGYLKFHTDSIELVVAEERMVLEFFVHADGKESAHEQVMARLKRLRSALPFCQRYESRGIWHLPFGLSLSFDETIKNLQRETLPYESDVAKNSLLRRTVTRQYLPDSYFHYEEAWYALRKEALQFVKSLSRWIQVTFAGKVTNLLSITGNELPVRLEHSLRYIPILSSEALEDMGKNPSPSLREALRKGGTSKWIGSFHSFFLQLLKYLPHPQRTTAERVTHDFREVVQHLHLLHEHFARLFEEAPDYFAAIKLNESENDAYALLANLLEVWLLDPPRIPQRDLVKYIEKRRDLHWQELLQQLKHALKPLADNGMTVILPTAMYVDYPLRYLPIGFSVSMDELTQVAEARTRLVNALTAVKDIADFFCLVPTYQGARFVDGGYQVSAVQMWELEQGQSLNWETLALRSLPDAVTDCLPMLPYQPSIRMQVQNKLLGLLGTLSVFQQHKDRIATLMTTQDPFEHRLWERYLVWGAELEAAVRTMSEETLMCLRTACGLEQDSREVETLVTFATTVREACYHGRLYDGLKAGDVNVKSISTLMETFDLFLPSQ